MTPKLMTCICAVQPHRWQNQRGNLQQGIKFLGQFTDKPLRSGACNGGDGAQERSQTSHSHLQYTQLLNALHGVHPAPTMLILNTEPIRNFVSQADIHVTARPCLSQPLRGIIHVSNIVTACMHQIS